MLSYLMEDIIHGQIIGLFVVVVVVVVCVSGFFTDVTSV